MKKKIFAVKRGRNTGIFNKWEKCRKHIIGYPNPEYLSFEYQSELAEEPEDVPGSLRYAMKKAEEFLGDLVYLGGSADYLEDATWERYGFLPFGKDFADSGQFIKNLEGNKEKHDKWLLADNINTHDVSMKSWDADIPYWEIADAMKKCIERIRYGCSDTDKKEAADSLKAHLERCVMDENLKDITKIYRNKKEENAIGYNPPAVSEFVTAMLKRYPNRYPKPKIIETKRQDPAAGLKNGQQTVEERRFDVLDMNHRDALTDLIVQMVRQQIPFPDGVELCCFNDEWEIRVHGKTIAIYGIWDEDDEDAYYCTIVRDYSLVSELVNGTPGLLDLVMRKITA